MASSCSTSGRRPSPRLPAGACAGRDRLLIQIGSSRRRGERCDRGSMSALLSVRLRGFLDRFANADIGPATADVAGHRVVDIGVRWMRVARQQRRSGHDLARLAVAALHDFVVEPGLLDLGASRCRADRLDRGDLGGAYAVDRGYAGTGGGTVDMYGAGAAERHPATE